MFDNIRFPFQLIPVVDYHESKCRRGLAQLIHAHGFCRLPQELARHDKIERFQKLMQLNQTVKYQLIHISLNFHPLDQPRLSPHFLIHIADEFMFRIGFGDQPYLVYEHYDAGHPHIHMLSTLIRQDGRNLRVYFAGGRLTAPISRDLVQAYQLASGDNWEPGPRVPEGREPEMVKTGHIGTTKSISRVLNHVINQYKFSSLEELNALLRLYNVQASRGTENSHLYKCRGLVYFITNEKGQKRTVPVKASKLDSKPTLNLIERKARQHQSSRALDRLQLQSTLQWTLQKQPRLLGHYAAGLKRKGIELLVQRTENGGISEFTYVDHRHKTVFMDRDLDGPFRAEYVLKRLSGGRDQQYEKQTVLLLRRRTCLERVALPDTEKQQQGSPAPATWAFRHKDRSLQPECCNL